MPWVPSRPALGVRLPFKGPQLSLGPIGHIRMRRAGQYLVSHFYSVQCGRTEPESAPAHREQERKARLG